MASEIITPKKNSSIESKSKMEKTLSVKEHPSTVHDRLNPTQKSDAPQKKKNPWAKGYDIPVITWIVALHLFALAFPFYFTWKALAIFAVLSWMTGSVGVCLGYHRLLTHGSFETYRPIRWFLATMGTLAGEGPPVTWVAKHRKHHYFSDKEGDPHSPRDGGWWSHVLWLTPNDSSENLEETHRRYALDLDKDPYMRFLRKTFLLWHWAVGAALFCWGYYGWDLYTGISFLVYGTFLRTVTVLHVTWFVNSASHIWGYRNYETSDDSKNLWWVGLLAFGEGWHNNHHAYQRMARHGHKWWEVDMTYNLIRLMSMCGLAWNVVKDIPSHKPA